MKTTTYKCDRCGAEDTTNEIGLQQVGVHVGGYAYYGNQTKVNYSQEWCHLCLTETGMVYIDRNKPSLTEPIPLSLEDLVREIVREEIQLDK